MNSLPRPKEMESAPLTMVNMLTILSFSEYRPAVGGSAHAICMFHPALLMVPKSSGQFSTTLKNQTALTCQSGHGQNVLALVETSSDAGNNRKNTTERVRIRTKFGNQASYVALSVTWALRVWGQVGYRVARSHNLRCCSMDK